MKAAIFVAIAALAGCGGGASSTTGRGRANAQLASGKPTALKSAAGLCKGFGESGQLQRALAPRDLVGRMMCNGSYRGDLWKALYSDFDEQMFGHFTAALMVVDCVGEGVCAPAGARRSPVAIGALSSYARRIDGTRVMTALNTIDLPAQMRTDFMDRLAASQREIIRLAGTLDPRRKELYVTLPAQVRARRAAARKAMAPLFERAELLTADVEAALKSRSATAAHVARVRTLRDDFVRACETGGRPTWECLAGPVARPMTELMVRLAIALRDPVLGHAENTLLEVPADLTRVQAEIFAQQSASMAAERTRWNDFTAAARTGIDPRLLAATTGVKPPVDLGNETALSITMRPISWRPVIERLERDTPVAWLAGEVASISRGGDSAMVKFRSETPAAGKRQLLPWVRVPSSDVRNVRPGMWLVAVAHASTKAGHVANVREAAALTSKVLQRRSFALTAPAPATLARR